MPHLEQSARCASSRVRSPAGSVPSRYSVTSSTSSLQFSSPFTIVSDSPFVEVALERLPHLGTRAMQQHSLISLGDSQSITDLFRGPPLDVAQGDHFSLR